MPYKYYNMINGYLYDVLILDNFASLINLTENDEVLFFYGNSSYCRICIIFNLLL